jgi:hypothetical protein
MLFKDAGRNVDVILPDDSVVTLRLLLELIYTGNALTHDSILLKKIDTLSKVVGFPFEKLVIRNVPYTTPLVETEELYTHNENDDIESVHDGFGIDYVDDEPNWLEGTTNNDQQLSADDTPLLIVDSLSEVAINTEDHTMPINNSPLNEVFSERKIKDQQYATEEKPVLVDEYMFNIDSPSNSVFKEKTCRLCQKTFQHSSWLIRHLTNDHYRTKILDKFSQHYNLETKSCQLCQKRISNSSSFVQHMGGRHKISLDYYKNETEYDFVPINSDQNFSPEGSIDGSDLEWQLSSSSNFISVKQLGTKSNKCQVCGKNHETKRLLLQHMSYAHFQTQIRQDYGEALNLMSCPMCKRQQKSISRFIIHIGATHRKVYDYLDNENATLSGSAKSHECHYCDFSSPMSNSSLILQHLSVSHFRDRLMAKYGQTFDVDKTCQLCQKKLSFNSISSFLCHIGSAHGKALDLLKEDGISHNIIKNKKGRKKMVKSQEAKRDKTVGMPAKKNMSPVCHQIKPLKVVLAPISTVMLNNSSPTSRRSASPAGRRSRSRSVSLSCSSSPGFISATDSEDEFMPKNAMKEYLQCPDCKYSCPKRSSLVRHQVTVHYFTQMASKYEDQLKSNNYSCHLCEKKFDSIQDGLIHLAFKHEKVEEFVDCPQIVKPDISKAEVVKPLMTKRQCRAQTNNAGLAKPHVWPLMTNNDDLAKALVCPCCGEKKSNSTMILNHLSVSHFRDRLMAKYGQSFHFDKSCQLCGKKMSTNSKTAFLWHIGSTHLKALDLLEEDGISHNIVKAIRGHKLIKKKAGGRRRKKLKAKYQKGKRPLGRPLGSSAKKNKSPIIRQMNSIVIPPLLAKMSNNLSPTPQRSASPGGSPVTANRSRSSSVSSRSRSRSVSLSPSWTKKSPKKKASPTKRPVGRPAKKNTLSSHSSPKFVMSTISEGEKSPKHHQNDHSYLEAENEQANKKAKTDGTSHEMQKEYLQCPDCEQSFPKRSSLVKHLVADHYFNLMAGKYDSEAEDDKPAKKKRKRNSQEFVLVTDSKGEEKTVSPKRKKSLKHLQDSDSAGSSLGRPLGRPAKKNKLHIVRQLNSVVIPPSSAKISNNSSPASQGSASPVGSPVAANRSRSSSVSSRSRSRSVSMSSLSCPKFVSANISEGEKSPKLRQNDLEAEDEQDNKKAGSSRSRSRSVSSSSSSSSAKFVLDTNSEGEKSPKHHQNDHSVLEAEDEQANKKPKTVRKSQEKETEYLKCPDCEHLTQKRFNLVKHMVTEHYFTLLAGMYEDQLVSNNMSCHLCEKKFDAIQDGLFHLAFKHEKLEEFVDCPQIMKPDITKARYKVKIMPAVNSSNIVSIALRNTS